MRSTLLFALAILLVLGVLFARDRLKLAFQVGAVLYGILLVVRFVAFGSSDPDNFLDLAAVGAIFGLVWLAAWAAVSLMLRRRARSGSGRQ